MTVVIGPTPTSFLNYSLVSVFHGTQHILLVISISALSNFNPTSAIKGFVWLPQIILLLTQLAYTLAEEFLLSKIEKMLSERQPSIADSRCIRKISDCTVTSIKPEVSDRLSFLQCWQFVVEISY